jgi:hypothetical protein
MDVFCLEGNWDYRHLDSPETVRYLLELVQSCEDIEYVHRDVATKPELEYYIQRWGDRAHRDFEFGYFAFHGDEGKAILLDEDALTLGGLATMLAKHAAGRGCIVHIASCHGLATTETQLERFLRKTDALVVCGYEQRVDTLRAAAFELLMLRELAGDWSLADRKFKNIVDRYDRLADELGFVYAIRESAT